MLLNAKKLRDRTNDVNDNSATEFWEEFKDKLFEKMKDRSDKGYYNLSMNADQENYSEEDEWLYDKNLTNKVINELKKLGYSLSYDRYRGFIEVSWK